MDSNIFVGLLFRAINVCHYKARMFLYFHSAINLYLQGAAIIVSGTFYLHTAKRKKHYYVSGIKPGPPVLQATTLSIALLPHGAASGILKLTQSFQTAEIFSTLSQTAEQYMGTKLHQISSCTPRNKLSYNMEISPPI